MFVLKRLLLAPFSARRGLRRTSGAMSSSDSRFLGVSDLLGVCNCSSYCLRDTLNLDRATMNSSFSSMSFGTVFFTNLYSCSCFWETRLFRQQYRSRDNAVIVLTKHVHNNYGMLAIITSIINLAAKNPNVSNN